MRLDMLEYIIILKLNFTLIIRIKRYSPRTGITGTFSIGGGISTTGLLCLWTQKLYSEIQIDIYERNKSENSVLQPG
jgi:hypothetical protein